MFIRPRIGTIRLRCRKKYFYLFIFLLIVLVSLFFIKNYAMSFYVDFTPYAAVGTICRPSKAAKSLLANDICYNPKKKTIILFQLSDWSDLDALAVTTAAVHNPNHGVCVLMMEGVQTSRWYLDKWLKLGNVQLTTLEPEKILKNTVIFHWYYCACSTVADRKYIMVEMSDAFRLAYIFNYGGIYLDTDVITLKSFDGLANTMSWLKEPVTINGAVMAFDKGNEFLAEVVNTFPLFVKAGLWGTSGPHLLSHVYHERRKRREDDVKIINLLPKYAFNPFFFDDGPLPFRAKSYDLMVEICKDAYTLHLYRTQFMRYWYKTSQPEAGSFVGKILAKYA